MRGIGPRWPAKRSLVLVRAGLRGDGGRGDAARAPGQQLHAFWRDTIVYQANRDTPFSVWGLWGGLGLEQHLLEGAVVALAILLAFVPADAGVVEVAALAGAVVIALQLVANYWLYSYIVWFFPAVVVGLFGVLPGAGRAGGGAAPAWTRRRWRSATPGPSVPA